MTVLARRTLLYIHYCDVKLSNENSTKYIVMLVYVVDCIFPEYELGAPITGVNQ